MRELLLLYYLFIFFFHLDFVQSTWSLCLLHLEIFHLSASPLSFKIFKSHSSLILVKKLIIMVGLVSSFLKNTYFKWYGSFEYWCHLCFRIKFLRWRKSVSNQFYDNLSPLKLNLSPSKVMPLPLYLCLNLLIFKKIILLPEIWGYIENFEKNRFF